MMIHPKARAVISQLSLPSPIQKYFSNLNWELDLSNNTNPYEGNFSEYPDIKQDSLKELYLKVILSLNPSFSFHQEEGEGLTFENVLFTVGSMEGLDLLLRTFSEPNKDVICIASPTFPAYEHWALVHSLEIKTLSFLGEEFNQIDIEEVVRTNPKMLFVCDPNNPTGTKIGHGVIQKLCESLEGFVIVDEAYIEFSDQPSAIFSLNKYRNLIILRTFSKAWGLAGIRCGAIIADKLVINALRYIQLPFGLSSFSQEKVRKKLLHPGKTITSWEKIKTNRENLIHKLSNLSNVSRIFKSDANFMMVVLKDFQKTMDYLTKHKIHVLDCSSSIRDSVRVSLGTKEQNMKFLEAMREASYA